MSSYVAPVLAPPSLAPVDAAVIPPALAPAEASVLPPGNKPRAADAAIRLSWRLSPSGTFAACTVVRSGRPAVLERQALGALGGDRARSVHIVNGLGPHSQLMPLDDGAVLMCHHRAGGHDIERLGRDGVLTALARSVAQGFALVPGIHGPYGLEFNAGTSQLVRIGPDGLRPLADLPGVAVGAVWLDAGQRLAVNVAGDGRPCSALVVELSTGAVEDLFSVSPTSDDRVIDYLPGANLIVVATDATGENRLGIGYPGTAAVRFPESLKASGPVAYLAASTDGERLAVSIDEGVNCRIRLVDTRAGTARDLELPPLVVMGQGVLTDGILVVPVSTPDRPGTLLRVDCSTGASAFDDAAVMGSPGFEVHRLPGADGEIEALVAGDPATAATVVIALHGGPLEAWRAMFDPLLAELAAAGIALVAPNVRGSTGYGRAHALAIRDNWGGPDLADVLAVADAVNRRRRRDADRPVVLGMSYGAYLAILAASSAPPRWSGCVALAPFLSGARVVATGGPVAELVRRLGGTSAPDVRAGLHDIAAPMLVLHGVHDDVVPVGESRILAAAMREHGKDITLHEFAGAGHDLVGCAQRAQIIDEIRAFCLRHRGPIQGDDRSTAQERRE